MHCNNVEGVSHRQMRYFTLNYINFYYILSLEHNTCKYKSSANICYFISFIIIMKALYFEKLSEMFPCFY